MLQGVKALNQIDSDNVKVLEKELKNWPWKVLEAIHITKKKTT